MKQASTPTADTEPPPRPRRFEIGDLVERDGNVYIVTDVSDPRLAWRTPKLKVEPVDGSAPLDPTWCRQSLFRWLERLPLLLLFL